MRGCILAVVAVATGTSAAAAQQGPALPRPSVSPYLNLLRNNNNNTPAYLNYYGLVRPELQARAGLAGLQQQLTTSNQVTQSAFAALGTANPDAVVTSAPAGFFTHRSYFLTTGTGGAAGSFGTNRVSGNAPAITPPAAAALPRR